MGSSEVGAVSNFTGDVITEKSKTLSPTLQILHLANYAYEAEIPTFVASRRVTAMYLWDSWVYSLARCT